MGFISRAIIGVIAVIFLGYAAFLYWPQTRKYQRENRAFEMSSRQLRGIIEIDGKTGTIEIPEPFYPVSKIVYDGTVVKGPSRQEKLHGWLLAGVFVMAAFAIFSVIGAWTLYHWHGKTPPKELNGKMDKILTATIAFAFGLGLNISGQEPVSRETYPSTESAEVAPATIGNEPSLRKPMSEEANLVPVEPTPDLTVPPTKKHTPAK
jgi:hypothetical protein